MSPMTRRSEDYSEGSALARGPPARGWPLESLAYLGTNARHLCGVLDAGRGLYVLRKRRVTLTSRFEEAAEQATRTASALASGHYQPVIVVAQPQYLPTCVATPEGSVTAAYLSGQSFDHFPLFPWKHLSIGELERALLEATRNVRLLHPVWLREVNYGRLDRYFRRFSRTEMP